MLDGGNISIHHGWQKQKKHHLPSLKLTAIAAQHGWLEDDEFSFWEWAYFHGRLLLVSGCISFFPTFTGIIKCVD